MAANFLCSWLGACAPVGFLFPRAPPLPWRQWQAHLLRPVAMHIDLLRLAIAARSRFAWNRDSKPLLDQALKSAAVVIGGAHRNPPFVDESISRSRIRRRRVGSSECLLQQLGVLAAVAPQRGHRCPDFLGAVALDLIDQIFSAFQGEEARTVAHIRAQLPHGDHDLMRIEQLSELGMVEPTILLGNLNEMLL